ncbi:hypothetical protein FVE85_5131 [Porphyridium purpureum]|uniref:Uncharacterized protein n=1 Tax=Porphyridium purpureum TaxID=35688 RepID=A0A5J4Z1P9_PORPP|nr:hypothetical protein FVE85_5131 [Porphyridium purpureum]|eukprot:POR6769..scf295_1
MEVLCTETVCRRRSDQECQVETRSVAPAHVRGQCVHRRRPDPVLEGLIIVTHRTVGCHHPAATSIVKNSAAFVVFKTRTRSVSEALVRNTLGVNATARMELCSATTEMLGRPLRSARLQCPPTCSPVCERVSVGPGMALHDCSYHESLHRAGLHVARTVYLASRRRPVSHNYLRANQSQAPGPGT